MMKTKYFYTIFIYTITCASIFSQSSGHLKFGLMEFEMVDTPKDPDVMILLKKRFEKSMNSDAYFNQDTMLEVRNKEELKISYKIFYDLNSPNVVSFFLTSPEGNYFVRDSTLGLLENFETSKKDKKKLQKLFRTSDTDQDRKTIFGFECAKITMLDPVDKQTEIITAYIAPAIPNLTSSLNPLSMILPGYPLESTTIMDGYKITWGAISFEPLNPKENVFEINTDGYTQIEYEEMKEILGKYLDL